MNRRIDKDLLGVREQPINSKLKGNRVERLAAKFMEKLTSKKFTRVPQSGGIHWMNMQSLRGDLICEDVNFPFVIEVKARKFIALSKTLRDNSIIKNFWAQVFYDAKSVNKHPLLLLHIDGMGDKFFVVTDKLMGIDVDMIGCGIWTECRLFVYKGEAILRMGYDRFYRNICRKNDGGSYYYNNKLKVKKNGKIKKR